MLSFLFSQFGLAPLVSKRGWRAKDLDALLMGFGFEHEDGTNHATYTHITYPDLITQIPRHPKELHPKFVTTAVRLVDELIRRENKEY